MLLLELTTEPRSAFELGGAAGLNLTETRAGLAHLLFRLAARSDGAGFFLPPEAAGARDCLLTAAELTATNQEPTMPDNQIPIVTISTTSADPCLRCENNAGTFWADDVQGHWPTWPHPHCHCLVTVVATAPQSYRQHAMAADEVLQLNPTDLIHVDQAPVPLSEWLAGGRT